jgi:hypothetical protein
MAIINGINVSEEINDNHGINGENVNNVSMK